MEKMHSTKETSPADDVDVQIGEATDTLGPQVTATSERHGEYKRTISTRQVHVSRKTLSYPTSTLSNPELLGHFSGFQYWKWCSYCRWQRLEQRYGGRLPRIVLLLTDGPDKPVRWVRSLPMVWWPPRLLQSTKSLAR